MKKNIVKIISTLLALSMCSITSFAHSGRTDANGGHRDNKNKSGLGYYHYHCGGHPPHLHPNGVCPYSSSSSSTSSSSYSSSSSSSYSSGYSSSSGSTSSSSHIYNSGSSSSHTYNTSTNYSQPKKTISKKVYVSSNVGYLNGEPIQFYNIEGDSREFIIAEDLADYGFDVRWVENWGTLYISKNDNLPKKQYVNVPDSPVYLGEYTKSDYCLRLAEKTFNYKAESYPLGGVILVPTTELKCYNIK